MSEPECTHPTTVDGRHVASGCEIRLCTACGVRDLLEPMPLIACCNSPAPCGYCWYCKQRAAKPRIKL